jgi:OFA family oxalate/formate antiporter-like MFS transporter
MTIFQQARLLLGSVLMMGLLGCVYTWGLFSTALHSQYQLSSANLQMVFGVEIAVYSVTMILSGALYPRFGVKPLAAVAGVLYGLGYWLATVLPLPWGLLVGIGIVSGMGIGFGYTPIMTNLMQAYPTRKGLAAGVVTAAFGGGATLMGLAVNPLLEKGMNVLELLHDVGIAFWVLMALGWLLVFQATKLGQADRKATISGPAIKDVIRTPIFITLFIGFFSGSFAGFCLLGNLKTLGLTLNVLPAMAGLAIMTFSVGNAVGRVSWGALADRFPSVVIPLALMLSSATIASVLVAPPVLFPLVAAAIAFCFGANYVLFANQIAEHFGLDQVARLYPVLLMSQVAAALSGPALSGWWLDTFGNLTGLVWVAASVALLGALVQVLTMRATVDTPAT